MRGSGNGGNGRSRWRRRQQAAGFRGLITDVGVTLPGFQGRTTINHPEDERGETQGERKRERVKQQYSDIDYSSNWSFAHRKALCM